jgi:hypothetical protein
LIFMPVLAASWSITCWLARIMAWASSEGIRPTRSSVGCCAMTPVAARARLAAAALSQVLRVIVMEFILCMSVSAACRHRTVIAVR